MRKANSTPRYRGISSEETKRMVLMDNKGNVVSTASQHKATQKEVAIAEEGRKHNGAIHCRLSEGPKLYTGRLYDQGV